MTLEATDAAIRKRHGKHYTPVALADFLAERLLATTLTTTSEVVRILDPSCGDGELLFAMDRVRARTGIDVELELVGYDIDSEAIRIAKDRAAALGVSATFECQDFLVASDEMKPDSFDGIITNPPYVRTQQLGGAAAKLLAEKYGLTGRVDLTHPFVSIAPRILRASGVLALLCSNRFLSTKSGSNVREVFERGLAPVELYDLGDTKLFGAAVLPAIVVAVKQQLTEQRSSALYMSVYESAGAQTDLDLFDALNTKASAQATWGGKSFVVKSGTLEQGSGGSAPWRMGGTDEEVWFTTLMATTWKTFGEVAKIRVGIKTTADSVFIRDRWDDLPPSERPEPELLLPLTTHHNITRWRFSPGALSVLYPYRLDCERRTVIDPEHYPRTLAYFELHRERLEGRKYVIEGGRQWFEIWVPQKPAQWKEPKLVFPDISEEPKFALDYSGAVVNGDCYWMSADDIGSEDLMLLMLGVANSATAVRFYDHVCGNKLYAGRRRWISQYVSRFPIPNPTSSESQDIVRLVRSLVHGTGAIAQGANEELDRLVEVAFASGGGSSDFLF